MGWIAAVARGLLPRRHARRLPRFRGNVVPRRETPLPRAFWYGVFGLAALLCLPLLVL